MNRIFAIGDIHGHHTELMALMAKLEEEAGFSHDKDHLVLLGDLVDAGSDASLVLEWCIKMQASYPDTFHVVKGNHEDLLLDALNDRHPIYGDYYIWWNQGGKQTLKSYTDRIVASDYEKALMQPLDIIPVSHIDFLKSLPLYWETEDYFFCHAGLKPGIQIKDVDFLDPKVQEALIWIREEFTWSNFDFGKKIIFGHTPFRENDEFVVLDSVNKIGINTMPRNEGYLTAVELPAEKFYKQYAMPKL